MQFIDIQIKPLEEINQATIIAKLGYIAGVAYQKYKATNEQRLQYCMRSKHDSILEHQNVTVEIICDIGTGKALTRHRHCAFTQESTIYCDYTAGGMTFINPPVYATSVYEQIERWYNELAAETKLKRDIIPHSVKTSLVVTTNLREWRYILTLRKDPKDSPRMHTTINKLQAYFKEVLPFFFDDIV